jgi:hypothetical protein
MKAFTTIPLALMLLNCAMHNPNYTAEQQFFANSYEFLADASKVHETSMVTIGQLHREGVIDDATLFRARTIGKALETSLRGYRTSAKVALEMGTGDQRKVLMAMSEVSRLLADILEIIEEHRAARMGEPL